MNKSKLIRELLEDKSKYEFITRKGFHHVGVTRKVANVFKTKFTLLNSDGKESHLWLDQFVVKDNLIIFKPNEDIVIEIIKVK